MGEGRPDDPPPSESNGFFKRAVRWLISPFIITSKQEVEKFKVLEINAKNDNEEDYLISIRLENFIVGSAWGVISGYSSKIFFLPVPDKFKALKLLGYFRKYSYLKFLQKYDVLYPSLIAFRVVKRGVLAGLVFDQAEQKSAKHFGLGHSTSSTLIGLAVLSMFFRITTDIRDNLIACSSILGGYAMGTQLAKFVRSFKKEPGEGRFSSETSTFDKKKGND